MNKLCVGVIFGGTSLEHEVSLESAHSIINAMDKSCFEVVLFCMNKKGCLYLYEWIDDFTYKRTTDDNRCILFNEFYRIKKDIHLLLNKPYQCISFYNDRCSFIQFDVIFPIIHGVLGEDGSLQGFLRIFDAPFVGTGVLGSSISMDKDISKRILRDAGFSVAPFITFTDNDIFNVNFEDITDILGLPLFVKPANQGSSIGVSKVNSKKEFYHALNLAFSFHYKILVESAVIGREIECAVLGNENPQVSVCGEVLLKKGGYYTYSAKYLDERATNIAVPALLSDKITADIRSKTLQVFNLLNCSGMVRVDFFLTNNNKILINEVNTLPGLSSASMYPKLWEASGINYTSLITRLITLSLDQYYHRK